MTAIEIALVPIAGIDTAASGATRTLPERGVQLGDGGIFVGVAQLTSPNWWTPSALSANIAGVRPVSTSARQLDCCEQP